MNFTTGLLLVTMAACIGTTGCTTGTKLPQSQSTALKKKAMGEFERLTEMVNAAGRQGVAVLAEERFTDATWSLGNLHDILDNENALIADLDLLVQATERQLKDAEEEAKKVRLKVPEAAKARERAITAGASDFPKELAELSLIDEDFKMVLFDFSKSDRKGLIKVVERYKKLYIQALQTTHLDEIRNTINTAAVRGAKEKSKDKFQEALRRLEIATQSIATHPTQPERFRKNIQRAITSANSLAVSMGEPTIKKQ